MQKSHFFITVIFVIILSLCYLFPLHTNTTKETKMFSHVEKKDYGPTAIPRVLKTRIYDDGTVVARIVRKNMKTATGVCFHEILSLRIIHPDGFVDEKDIKLDIPSFNYCFVLQQNGRIEFLDYYLISKNHILITYYNAVTNHYNVNNYEEWGMIIDLDGNELDRIFFGPAFIVDATTHQFISDRNSKISLNVNGEKGFLRLFNLKENQSTSWEQYRIEPDGKFTKLTDGTLGFGSLSGTIISTVEEGYAIVYTNTINNFIETEPFIPRSLFLSTENDQPVSPLTFYKDTSLNVTCSVSHDCDILFVGVSQPCFLIMSQKDPAGLLPDKNFYANINFFLSPFLHQSIV